MIDMTEFDSARAKPPKRRSMIDIFLEDLEEKDSVRYQQLLTALNQKEEYSAPTIVRVVNGWGFDISTTAIKDWRRKNA